MTCRARSASTAGRKRPRGRAVGWSRSGGKSYTGRLPYHVYIYLYRSTRAAILSSPRRHRTSTARVRPGAFLLDATRSTDDDTSAAATHGIMFYIYTRIYIYIYNIYGRVARRSVRRGFSLPRDTPRYSHLKYKSLSRAPPRRSCETPPRHARARLAFSLVLARSRHVRTCANYIHSSYTYRIYIIYLPPMLLAVRDVFVHHSRVCPALFIYDLLQNCSSIYLQFYLNSALEIHITKIKILHIR
jgi:hypothetical protein